MCGTKPMISELSHTPPRFVRIFKKYMHYLYIECIILNLCTAITWDPQQWNMSISNQNLSHEKSHAITSIRIASKRSTVYPIVSPGAHPAIQPNHITYSPLANNQRHPCKICWDLLGDRKLKEKRKKIQNSIEIKASRCRNPTEVTMTVTIDCSNPKRESKIIIYSPIHRSAATKTSLRGLPLF
jgi:hypothetical protein